MVNGAVDGAGKDFVTLLKPKKKQKKKQGNN
jgi:ribosomal protein L3